MLIETTKIHREDNKRWNLPTILTFGQYIKRYSAQYKVLGYRFPKKGEYYLSGAKIEVYVAPNDLSNNFLVVEPTVEMKTATVWVEKVDQYCECGGKVIFKCCENCDAFFG